MEITFYVLAVSVGLREVSVFALDVFMAIAMTELAGHGGVGAVIDATGAGLLGFKCSLADVAVMAW